MKENPLLECLGRLTRARRGSHRAEESATDDLSSPLERHIALRGAREVMVALGDRLPGDVEAWLGERDDPGSVEILCQGFPDAAYLLNLVERGYQLFDAYVPLRTYLFLNRKQCYALPAWHTVPNGFALAYALLWQRTGCYVSLEGTVTELAERSGLFKVATGEGFWTWVTPSATCVTPPLGSNVKVLGIDSWIGGGSAAILHGVLLADLCNGAKP